MYVSYNVKIFLIHLSMKFWLLFILLPFVTRSQEELTVDFSVVGGVYEQSWEIELTGSEGSTIYYSMDGSTPNSGSTQYNGTPISVSSIAIIRAIAYKDGRKSPVNTQSYFTDRAYSLPVISLVTDPVNFWDYSSGIYVKGCCADSAPPYLGANFWKGWERPCNIEMYDNKGKLCFNQMAGVRIFGGFSKMLPQKSLSIIARKKYGKSKFKYPIFSERKHKSYKTFIIRNSGGDFKRTQLRDAYMTQLAKPTGIAIQAYEPAIVFINGEYWGIHNIREKLNEHYLEANFGVNKDKVDLLKHKSARQHGSSNDYRRLLAFLRRYNLEEDKWVDSLSKFMDIHDFITYNICETYSQNQDAGGNIRYFKERKPGAKWRWILFDLDLGLGNTGKNAYKENTIYKFTTLSGEVWPNPAWSTLIIRSLLNNKRLERQYINTFCDYLNTVFHEDSASALLTRMKKVIETEIPYHQKRWKASVKNWDDNIERIRTFVVERPKYLKQYLAEKFELSEPVNIRVVVPDKEKCMVQINCLKLESSFTGQYFKSVPITVKVSAKHDYELVGWKNRSEKSTEITVNPEEGLILEPILEAKPFSNFQDSIIINEISFSQVDTDSTDDWIELYNRASKPINLSGWSITKRKYRKGFYFEDMILEPKGHVIISKNKVNFYQKFGLDTGAVYGNMKFGLSKSGGIIKLYDDKGLIVEQVSYSDDYRLIDSAFTYALIHPDSTRQDVKNWTIQIPTPLTKNQTHIRILKDLEAKARFRKMIMIAVGGGVILLLVMSVVIRSRRKKRKAKVLSG